MTITIEKELTNDHIRVLNVLRNTKHEIITKQNIFNQLNMEFNRNNDRWLRNTINSLVVDYGYPIGIAIKKMQEVISWLNLRNRKN